jgi:hypothetical protein
MDREGVEQVMYLLGPLADDGFIEDPRDVLRHWKAGERNDIELAVNLSPKLSILQVVDRIDEFAVAVAKTSDGFVLGL